MKTRSIKKSQKLQKGFAMLEVMLAILIIAIASFGIYKLYTSASTSSKLTDEENTISQVYTAISKLSYSTGAAPSLAALKNSGVIPDDMWADTAKTKIRGAFSDITYTGPAEGAATTYGTLTALKIPQNAAWEFASHMTAIGDVYIGEKAFDPTTTTFTAATDIAIYVPKGVYSGK